MAEAELMSMAFELFRTLNLEITIQYNNRKLLNGILQAINIPTELTSDVILSLDKIEKIGIDGVRKDVLERGISKEMADTICNTVLSCLKLSIDDFKDAFNTPIVADGVNELQQLQQYLIALGINENAIFNPF